jgi:hypothetical protein
MSNLFLNADVLDGVASEEVGIGRLELRLPAFAEPEQLKNRCCLPHSKALCLTAAATALFLFCVLGEPCG